MKLKKGEYYMAKDDADTQFVIQLIETYKTPRERDLLLVKVIHGLPLDETPCEIKPGLPICKDCKQPEELSYCCVLKRIIFRELNKLEEALYVSK